MSDVALTTIADEKRPFLDTDGVSVCIANWNCRAMLRACLTSLCRQDQGVRVQVIVVDNASSDGAADMVAREFPEVELLRNEENRGFSRANNQAARCADGEYLFFLNNDTIVPPHTLGKLAAYLQANPDVSLVGPMLRGGDGAVQASYRDLPTVGVFLHRTLLLRWTGLFRQTYRRFRRQSIDQPRDVEVLLGAAMFLRRDDFRHMGGWDEDFHFGGEDMEFSLRARQVGRVMYLPTVAITHFGRASTRQHYAFACTAIAVGFVQYLRKSGCSRSALFAYKLAVTLDAPLQIVVKGLQYLYRRCLGRRDADKSFNVLRGQVPFLLRGLGAFWQA